MDNVSITVVRTGNQLFYDKVIRTILDSSVVFFYLNLMKFDYEGFVWSDYGVTIVK